MLNSVRRKGELKCPTENSHDELVVDLDKQDIGKSFTISCIKYPEVVRPTIQGINIVLANIALILFPKHA